MSSEWVCCTYLVIAPTVNLSACVVGDLVDQVGPALDFPEGLPELLGRIASRDANGPWSGAYEVLDRWLQRALVPPAVPRDGVGLLLENPRHVEDFGVLLFPGASLLSVHAIVGKPSHPPLLASQVEDSLVDGMPVAESPDEDVSLLTNSVGSEDGLLVDLRVPIGGQQDDVVGSM